MLAWEESVGVKSHWLLIVDIETSMSTPPVHGTIGQRLVFLILHRHTDVTAQ